MTAVDSTKMSHIYSIAKIRQTCFSNRLNRRWEKKRGLGGDTKVFQPVEAYGRMEFLPTELVKVEGETGLGKRHRNLVLNILSLVGLPI